MVPKEATTLFDLFRGEAKWIRRVGRQFNNKLPNFGGKAWKALQQLRLTPYTSDQGGICATVHRERTSLESPHSLEDALTLLQLSQQKVSVYASNQLFNKISARKRPETGVNLKRFLMIKCPSPGPKARAELREDFAPALSGSSAVTGLKDFYGDRIHVVAAAAPSVAQILTDNK